MDLPARVVARFLQASSKTAWDDGEEDDDSDDFSRESIEEGYKIQDGRRGGYEVYHGRKSLGHFDDWDDAIKAINRDMKKSNFYPNIYYVNERGNTDLLDEKGKTIRSRV